jgi:PTH1 family peptidyl-tRNA hydrolase
MLLIAGLGNPGPQYEGNRHNVGFHVVDDIARVHRFSAWRHQSKFDGETCEGKLTAPDGALVQTMLLKPQTYMNESGRSVGAVMRSKYLAPADVVVFHDEIDLALGRFRMSTGSRAAGHNGIRSIFALASPDIRRARMGVGHPGTKELVKGTVLSGFAPDEKPVIRKLIDACVQALPLLLVGNDERYQTEVMRLAPAPKADPRNPPPTPPPTEDKT